MSEKMPNDHTDPMWQMHMQILTKRMKNMEIAQTIDEAISEWYSLHDLPVPKWKMKRDPDWWIEYLRDLGIDPRNP